MTPDEHVAIVRDALHGDRITDPIENWAAADESLTVLVAQAKRAAELERERDMFRSWWQNETGLSPQDQADRIARAAPRKQ